MTFENSVPASKKIASFCFKKARLIMLYVEIIAVYCEINWADKTSSVIALKIFMA
jgi:hypothetical protein